MGYTSRQSTIVGVHWSYSTVAVILLGARLYVRTRLRPGTLGWDDWTMLLAYALSIGAGVVETLLVVHGVGKHMDNVDPSNFPEVSKLTLLNSILHLLGTMMVKVSICLFLLRIVHQANRTIKWLVTTNLAILVPFTVATVIVDLVQCMPLEGYWDKTVPAKCLDIGTVNILLKAASGVGVVTDFTTAAIPIVVVYRLHMPPKQKYAIYAVLALGFLTAGISIAKTISINWTPEDYTWDNSQVGYWGAIEHLGGIIAGCLVTLRPLFQLIHSRWFEDDTSEHSHQLKPVKRLKMKDSTNSDDELLRDAHHRSMQIRKMTEVEVSREATEGTSSTGEGRHLGWNRERMGDGNGFAQQ